MKKAPVIFLTLSAAFVLLMSLPWLVPHMGWTALLGLVPLLVMERLATEYKVKHFWWIQYACFVLWNAVTTWWVGGATVGGAVFAILAKARVPKAQVLYVGDSGVDMETARRACVDSVGVTWGFRSKKELVEYYANVIVNNPVDILGIVENGITIV